MPSVANKPASTAKVVLAFAIVYIVWGSTYFFIRLGSAYSAHDAGRHAIPPCGRADAALVCVHRRKGFCVAAYAPFSYKRPVAPFLREWRADLV